MRTYHQADVTDGLMLRTTLTLLLIPGVLLTQFATVPHAHGADADPHPTHPHFHFRLLNPSNAHRATGSSCCGPDSGSLTRAACAADSDTDTDHDADAVYVEAGTAVPERLEAHRAAPQSFAAPVPPQSLDFLRCVVTRLLPPSARPAERCPLYVRHLALTI